MTKNYESKIMKTEHNGYAEYFVIMVKDEEKTFMTLGYGYINLEYLLGVRILKEVETTEYNKNLSSHFKTFFSTSGKFENEEDALKNIQYEYKLKFPELFI